MEFDEWVNAAAKKIADPALNQQFTQLMSSIGEAAPDFKQFGQQSLMLHKDYSRVIHEQRTEREQLEQQLANEKAKLESDRLSSKALLENAASAQNVLDAYSKVHKVITELQLTDILFNEPVNLPEPITLNYKEEEIMAAEQFTESELATIKNWLQKGSEPAPTPAPAPVSQQEVVTPDMLQTVFAAATLATSEIMQSAQRYKELTGKNVNVSELSLQFHQSKRPLDEFLNEKLNLPTLEAEAAQKAQEQLIEARAQELFSNRVTQHLSDPANGGLVAASTGRPPLFDLLTTSPKLAQQSPSAAPAQSGSTPPPATPNSNEALAGLDSAAASLATGKYNGQRFDPLNPLGRQ